MSEVVVGGDYITTETGTGLVHTAPGHGQEDYVTGLKYGLPLLSPVDDAGKFTAEAGERFKGLNVLKVRFVGFHLTAPPARWNCCIFVSAVRCYKISTTRRNFRRRRIWGSRSVLSTT